MLLYAYMHRDLDLISGIYLSPLVGNCFTSCSLGLFQILHIRFDFEQNFNMRFAGLQSCQPCTTILHLILLLLGLNRRKS